MAKKSPPTKKSSPPKKSPPRRGKVGDDPLMGMGTSPSGRYATMGGKVLDPTNLQPFVRGKPHDNPTPVSTMSQLLKPAPTVPKPPPARPAAAPARAARPVNRIANSKDAMAAIDEQEKLLNRRR